MKKKRQKAISVLLVLALLMPIAGGPVRSTAQEVPDMRDVSSGDWFYRYVVDSFPYGLTVGTRTDEFRFEPNRPITRAEFVTMLGRLYEYGEDNTIAIPADDTFYGRYLAWAAGHNMISGDGSGNLMPHTPVTREQMAVIIDRYIRIFELREAFTFEVPGSWHSPADHGTISEWARSAVLHIRNYRLLSGNFGEWWYFRPQETTSRAEALAIFVRMCRVIYEGEFPIQ